MQRSEKTQSKSRLDWTKRRSRRRKSREFLGGKHPRELCDSRSSRELEVEKLPEEVLYGSPEFADETLQKSSDQDLETSMALSPQTSTEHSCSQGERYDEGSGLMTPDSEEVTVNATFTLKFDLDEFYDQALNISTNNLEQSFSADRSIDSESAGYDPSILTPAHRLVAQLANGVSVPRGIRHWDTTLFARWKAGLLNIDHFKNQWVCGYRDVINQASALYGIPANMLASVAHLEVGGDPEWTNDGERTRHRIFGTEPGWTTYGPMSIAVLTAAEVLGYDFNNLTAQQSSAIIRSLRRPKQAIFIAAKLYRHLQDTYFPGRDINTLQPRELMVVAGAYNAGKLPRERLDNGGHTGGYGQRIYLNVSEKGIPRLLRGQCRIGL